MNPHVQKPSVEVGRVVAAEFRLAAPSVAKLPPSDVPEVAFAGRSNVGKSSLLNVLLQRRRLVRTSGTPGCTRQINVFDVAFHGGLRLRFADLPGYGYAKVAKSERSTWGAMIEGYLLERPSLRGVVLLVDVRRGFLDEEAQLIDFLRARPEVRVLLAVTKCDQIPLAKRKPALAAIKARLGAQSAANVSVFGFSALSGDGRDELCAAIMHLAAPPHAAPLAEAAHA